MREVREFVLDDDTEGRNLRLLKLGLWCLMVLFKVRHKSKALFPRSHGPIYYDNASLETVDSVVLIDLDFSNGFRLRSAHGQKVSRTAFRYVGISAA